MSETEGSPERLRSPGTVVVRRDYPDRDAASFDFKAITTWVQQHQVQLGGLILIAVTLLWRATFLGHMYFTQDDFYNLDLAIESPFSWHYLTFNTAGNLVVGTQAITWLMARVSLYDWGLASAVSLAFLAGACLAALRLLRTLFGDRLVVLVPLGVYLLTPLTLPALGWWSAAMESVPLQLAIFAALNSHVLYVRTGRWVHLAAASGWLVFGLAFFEKALVLPVLLFAVTAAFLAGRTSWLAGARLALVRYWRAWAVYVALSTVYAVLLVQSLRTSVIHPQAPASFAAVLTFASALVKDTLLPGAIGGPWHWYPVAGGSFAVSAAPPLLILLSAVLVLATIATSILMRRTAWRSWAILAGWVVAADVMPVAIGRLSGSSAPLLALETRYVADAMPVLAICLGLAFLPLAREAPGVQSRIGLMVRDPRISQIRRRAIAVLAGVFIFGSIWSVQAYESTVTGAPARDYIAHAAQALHLIRRGTDVLDWPVPSGMVSPLFGKYANASTLIGDMERGSLSRRVHWISKPTGTIDGLMMFDDTGRMHFAEVYGAYSPPRTAAQGCWPERKGRIVVNFSQPSLADTWIARIGYIWPPPASGSISVHYGSDVRVLPVQPGVHAGYLELTGISKGIVIDGLGQTRMCVADVEAGWFAPAIGGPVIPPVSH